MIMRDQNHINHREIIGGKQGGPRKGAIGKLFDLRYIPLR